MIVILIAITTYILRFFYLFLQVRSPKHETQALFFCFPPLSDTKGWRNNIVQFHGTRQVESVQNFFPRSGCRKEQFF